MKIQIDTKNKRIKLEDDVKLKELIDFLDKILPDEWKNFTLETHTTINNWTNPIYIQPTTPSFPNPLWTCTSGTSELNDGIYNITTSNQTL